MDNNITSTLENDGFDVAFRSIYDPIHTPLVVIICIGGIIANTANILVHTHMPVNATNIILRSLSVAQLLLLLMYLPRTIYSGIFDGTCTYDAKTYPLLLLFYLNVNATLVTHTIGVAHVLLLGLFRYIIIHYPLNTYVSTKTAVRSAIATYIVVPIICTSMYVNSAIVIKDMRGCEEQRNEIAYELRFTGNHVLIAWNRWFFGVVCKVLPCVFLVIVTLLLIRDVSNAARRRQRLTRTASNNKMANGGNAEQARGNHGNESQHSTVTQMLCIIMCMFVSVELPQGIGNIIAALENSVGWNVTQKWYYPFGDLFEMLTVLYSSTNFVLYCGMSSQFREIFKRKFLGCAPVSRRMSQFTVTQLTRGPSGKRNGHNHRTVSSPDNPNSKSTTVIHIPLNSSAKSRSDMGSDVPLLTSINVDEAPILLRNSPINSGVALDDDERSTRTPTIPHIVRRSPSRTSDSSTVFV